jgi:hypothetical protein
MAAVSDLRSHVDVVGSAVGVDDLEIHNVHGISRHIEPDGLEAALAAPDSDRVVIDDKADLPAAELVPLAAGSLVFRRESRDANLSAALAVSLEIALGDELDAIKGAGTVPIRRRSLCGSRWRQCDAEITCYEASTVREPLQTPVCLQPCRERRGGTV